MISSNPNCDNRDKGKVNGTMSGCLLILLFWFGVVPGIIYYLWARKKGLACPKVRITLYIFIALLLSAGVLFSIIQSSIDEYGYVSDLNDISAIKEEKLFSSKLSTEGDLFFYRTGYLSDFALYIIGKFSSDTISKIISNHCLVDLPKPLCDYEDYFPISTFSWPLNHIPNDIAKKLQLRKKSHYYLSDLDDNAIWFKYSKNKYYVEIILLGKGGYFIIIVTHNTRH